MEIRHYPGLVVRLWSMCTMCKADFLNNSFQNLQRQYHQNILIHPSEIEMPHVNSITPRFLKKHPTPTAEKVSKMCSPKNIKIVLKNELSLQLWMSFHHLLNTDLNMLHCLLLWISNFHHIKKQSFFVKYLPPCHTDPDYLASHHFWPLQTECLKNHLCPLSCQHPSLLVGSLS